MTKELLLEAPVPELALPALPDFDRLPTGVLKTMIEKGKERIDTIGDHTDPESMVDKTFTENLVSKAESVIDSRGEA